MQQNPEEIAEKFWAGTNLETLLPRPIEQAIALNFPVTIVKLPEVNVRAVEQWLRRHFCSFKVPSCERDLMGCLFAHRGQGFIFVCGSDSSEEQRFTLAHDMAHFLVDYWRPRQRVIKALGPSITEVLDGERAASLEERAEAILSHIRLGSHWHLFPRRGVDPEDDLRIATVEARADDLGLELVAPRHRILEILNDSTVEECDDPRAICNLLGFTFGLPAYVFAEIISGLRPKRVPTFLEEAIKMLGRKK